jgi:hypothetical protein
MKADRAPEKIGSGAGSAETSTNFTIEPEVQSVRGLGLLAWRGVGLSGDPVSDTGWSQRSPPAR